MKLGVITSWPPEISGLSYYSKQLYETLASLTSRVKIIVYAHIPNKSMKENIPYIRKGNLEVKYIWTNKTPLYPFKLLKAIVKDNIQLVHVQHEYWLYGRGLKALLLPILLVFLRFTGKTTIITLHGLLVLTQLSKDFKKFHRFNISLHVLRMFSIIYVRALSLLSNTIVVHLNIMRKILEQQYGVKAEKIRVIPHGILDMESAFNSDCSNSKEIVFTTFGSLRPDKGIKSILRALNKLANIYSNVKLIIAGQYDPLMSPEAAGYLDMICNTIKKYGLEKHVVLKLNLPYREVYYIYRKSYAIILNYLDSSVVAASGPLALAIAFNKPVIASKIPRFLEYKDCILLITPNSVNELSQLMRKLIEDKELYKSITSKLKNLKNILSWQNIAKGYLRLYLKLAK